VSSVLDVWRAIDPEARLIAGSPDALRVTARGVARTRVAPPHLPSVSEGQLLVVDAAILRDAPLDELLAGLVAAELSPAALIVAGAASPEHLAANLPILLSRRSPAALVDAMRAYLGDEEAWLARLVSELRLATAEAALGDPSPSAPTALVADRLRRGVAVSADGELRAVHPRNAGRAIAARFSAIFARLLASGHVSAAPLRRGLAGVWLLEQPIRRGASVWLFDDLPFARIDEVAAQALGVTLRALLRRPPPSALSRAEPRHRHERTPAPSAPAPAPAPAASDTLTETLLAVARANGRVAPAARALGVHRNTVLYRLKVARAERGIDPRRPEDALRLLAEHQS
jgi:hypothetical protein